MLRRMIGLERINNRIGREKRTRVLQLEHWHRLLRRGQLAAPHAALVHRDVVVEERVEGRRLGLGHRLK